MTLRTTLASALRVGRSVLVGGAATLIDLGVLALLVEVAHLPATAANVPALLVGALVQFLGCRYFVFEAGAADLRKQAGGFAAVEVATLALNGLAFHALVAGLHVPYAAARPLGTFLVFISFSYPMWRLVFGAARPARAR
jgi:putative flippase GtrA